MNKFHFKIEVPIGNEIRTIYSCDFSSSENKDLLDMVMGISSKTNYLTIPVRDCNMEKYITIPGELLMKSIITTIFTK